MNRLTHRAEIERRWRASLTYLRRTREPVSDQDMIEAHAVLNSTQQMEPTQHDLFGNPVESVAPSEPPIDDVEFNFGNRGLRVVRVYGDDDAAPVIVEELTNRFTLKGQLALWSRQGVRREMEK